MVAKLSSFKIKKRFNDKLQQIDSPYFSVENLIAISEQLIKDNFSILHLNIRSLNVNIDNFRGFLGSLTEILMLLFLRNLVAMKKQMRTLY